MTLVDFEVRLLSLITASYSEADLTMTLHVDSDFFDYAKKTSGNFTDRVFQTIQGYSTRAQAPGVLRLAKICHAARPRRPDLAQFVLDLEAFIQECPAPELPQPEPTPLIADVHPADGRPIVEPTTKEEIETLRKILKAVDKPDFERVVAAIYHLVTGSKSPSLSNCLWNLKGRVPYTLILFVELCMRHLHSVRMATDALEEWLDTYKRHHVPPDAEEHARALQQVREKADRLAPQITREAEPKWRVHVVLKPVMGSIRGQEKYHLHYALREEGCLPEKLQNGSTGTLAELRKEFADFFEHIRDDAYTGTITLVEAIVPLEVLFACSDRWEIHDGELKQPLGRRYSTVMRSYERRYPREPHTRQGRYHNARDLQKQKWPDSIGHDDPSSSLVWDAKDLCNDLFEFWSRISTKAVVALTLTAPPDKVDDEHRVAERLVSSGIPVAVWLNGHAGGGKAGVRKLMKKLPDKVADLPCCVRDWTDADNNAFKCSGISLLWDNHDDPVPDLPLETFDIP